MRPTGLIAAREPGEVLALGDVVHHRHFFGHANGVAGRRDIADGADPGVLDMLRPERIDDAGAGRQLVAFRMHVMLDRADPPGAHLVGGLDDVDTVMKHPVVEFGIAPDGALRRTVGFVVGRQDRVQINNNFWLRHDASPLDDIALIRDMAYRYLVMLPQSV